MHKKVERSAENSPALPADIEAALFAGLDVASVSVAQSKRIRERIDAVLGGDNRITTRRRDEGEWIPVGDDYSIKILNRDTVSGIASFFVRIKPGGMLPNHEHRLVEECLILEGAVEVGSLELGVGDYQLLQAGSVHQDVRSPKGALLFIRAELPAAA